METVKIKVNLNKMPEWTQDNLTRETLGLLRRIQRQPGGREIIERKKAELRAAGRL